MMSMNDRGQAINRAQRALKSLGEHPRASKRELGHAREHLNTCYSLGDSRGVWEAVDKVEAMAARRYGVPDVDQPPATAPVGPGNTSTAPRAPTPEPATHATTSSTPAR